MTDTQQATEDRIWKYELEVTDEQQVFLPDGSWVLAVQFQNERLCLWARVEVGAPTKPWKVSIVGTGNPMPDQLGLYVGTVQEMGGALVWHVFIAPPVRVS